ncbi:unnamed protein product [Parajaminaea phylloscopi]
MRSFRLASLATLAAFLVAVPIGARNTDFDACDEPDGSLINAGYHGDAVTFTKGGLVPIEKSAAPVFYLSPGLSACGFNYTDYDVGACLDGGWINSAYHNGCNKWVEVTLPSTGARLTARVLDSCGNTLPKKNKKFHCNDIYLTLAAFSSLALGDKKIIDKGRLPGPVVWRFIDEPCWGCEAGLPGLKPHNEKDTCEGPDSWGIERHGRKEGDQRVKGAVAGEACSGFSSSHEEFKIEQFADFAAANGYRVNTNHQPLEDLSSTQSTNQQTGDSTGQDAVIYETEQTKTADAHPFTFSSGERFRMKIEDQKNWQTKLESSDDAGYERRSQRRSKRS